MQVYRIVCNICGAEAKDEKQKRHENWIELDGELRVWLEKRRCKNGGFMHSVAYKNRRADFCSIECLVKSLDATHSVE